MSTYDLSWYPLHSRKVSSAERQVLRSGDSWRMRRLGSRFSDRCVDFWVLQEMRNYISDEFKIWCVTNNIDLNTTTAESSLPTGSSSDMWGFCMSRCTGCNKICRSLFRCSPLEGHFSPQLARDRQRDCPIQRVIGVIPRLPSILTDRPSLMTF